MECKQDMCINSWFIGGTRPFLDILDGSSIHKSTFFFIFFLSWSNPLPSKEGTWYNPQLSKAQGAWKQPFDLRYVKFEPPSNQKKQKLNPSADEKTL